MPPHLRKILLVFVVVITGVYLLREPIVGLARGVYCAFYLRGETGELVMVSKPQGETAEWYLVDVDGRAICRVIGSALAAEYSSVAHQLAYVDAETQGIYVAKLDGSGARQVASSSGCNLSAELDLSPDGRFVTYLDHDPFAVDPDRYTCEVFVVEVATGATHKVSENLGVYDMQWSPDGQYLAYTTAATNELYVIKQDGTQRTRMIVISPWLTFFAWSPDSTQLAAINAENKVVTIGRDGTVHQVFDQPDRTTVTNLGWSWSGDYITMETFSGDIYTIDLYKNRVYPLIATPANESDFQWLVSGNDAVYFTDAFSRRSLIKVNVRNGSATILW